MSCIKIIRLSDEAIVPYKPTMFSAGYDLFAVQTTLVPPQSSASVSLGWKIKMPIGCCGWLAHCCDADPQAHCLNIVNTVVNHDDTEPLSVILYNHSLQPVEIAAGDRVAQLICVKMETPSVLQVPDMLF